MSVQVQQNCGSITSAIADEAYDHGDKPPDQMELITCLRLFDARYLDQMEQSLSVLCFMLYQETEPCLLAPELSDSIFHFASHSAVSCNSSLMYLISCIMHKLSTLPAGLDHLCLLDSFPRLLLHLLATSHTHHILNFAILSMHNLFVRKPYACDYFRNPQCIHYLLRHIQSECPKFLLVLLDCLFMLMHKDEEMTILFVQIGGIPCLFAALCSEDNKVTLKILTMLRSLLATYPQTKEQMLACDSALDILLYLLKNEEFTGTVLVLLSLLSDQLISLEMGQLMEIADQCVEEMRRNEWPRLLAALRILANLSCDNAKFKVLLLKNSVPFRLIQLMDGSSDDALLEAAFRILFHLTNVPLPEPDLLPTAFGLDGEGISQVKERLHLVSSSLASRGAELVSYWLATALNLSRLIEGVDQHLAQALLSQLFGISPHLQ
ncbi:Catenin beta-1 [Cichlidogyrus casuarinus]|uniref:Catenin beta-1 n=1 Tax=Cichlidogyrus casuarinus TaxID=1844966 RepID=A0ABD2QQ74_9PLAT